MTVTGEGLSILGGCLSGGSCSFTISSEGGSQAVVSAPGYHPANVAITRTEDDCGNTVTQEMDVVLMAEATTERSAVRVTGSSGCH